MSYDTRSCWLKPVHSTDIAIHYTERANWVGRLDAQAESLLLACQPTRMSSVELKIGDLSADRLHSSFRPLLRSLIS